MRALVTRRAFDGAEHSGSIEPVMAGQAAASAPFQVSRVQWCAIAITSGEDLQPEGILTVDIPGIENLLRCALNSSVAMDYLPADSRFAGTGFAEEGAGPLRVSGCLSCGSASALW